MASKTVNKPHKLPTSFYRRDDVVWIARNLLGKILCSRIEGTYTSGRITETEAYCGRNDKACHANNGTRTDRTETMYRPGGVAYVYLCYGIHHLFNVVTNVKGKADAVLIRAIEPVDGKKAMLKHRDMDEIKPSLTAGPGRLTQALGITTDFDGCNLCGPKIWIEDRGFTVADSQIQASPRIGVEYAGDHAERPWRLFLKNSRWIS